MPTPSDVAAAAELIALRFELEPPSPSTSSGEDALGALTARLTNAIRELLDADLARLTQLLYRIDVPEHEVEHAFQQGSVEAVARALVEQVLARTLLTVAQRRRFEEGGGG